MTKHQHSVGSDDCQAGVLPGLNFCVFNGGTLCYRHRFLLRKLLVNKVWSQAACRFEAWKTFCSRSCVLLDELLEVDRHQRRRCAFSRWKRVVYSQQLGEEAEATVIVRRSHQAAKILARVVTKHDKLVVLSVWVEWRTWHRKQRCVLFQRGAMFQKRRRFRQWLEFAIQLKAHHRHRVHQVREILSEVVNFSVVKAEFTRAAISNDDPNHKEIRAAKL
ncbi:hypothetical protein PF008_g18783 [Phytophthora fragariae]|uniref:Uncharacterized protein n=1 Tax=Phytophthora fragariae TaxID=53985 RepID=A0A6A3EBQ5_9STRA|nr:hypothetical protein PF009_g18898 [Phytophthora fragariae]KAE9317289.1 hypothetical protein PF008_g18783 [Phytophthora fragariae]